MLFCMEKKINLDIIVSQIEKVIPYLKLQRCLKLKSSFTEEKRERYASALTNMNLSNKVYKKFGKISLKNYIHKITETK